MRRTGAAAILLMLLAAGLPPPAAQAGWAPGPGDWSQFRRTPDHLGASPAVGAFRDDLADLRVKWQRTGDPGYSMPPTAADLDGDGVAEVAIGFANASVDTSNVNSPIALVSGLEVLDGATGGLRWRVGPTSGNIMTFSPVLGDVDNDGKGEVVFQDGNPLTGTFATNKVFAYSASGQKKWEWSDAGWGTKTPQPMNALAVGNVDGESGRDEVVFVLLLANAQTTIQGNKVVISLSNPEQRVIAINGEGSASLSWQRTFANASAASPALGDLDGDGVLDVVWGSGIKPGVFTEVNSVRVDFAAEFADDRLRAYAGGASAQELWTARFAGFFPGELLTAPTLADLDGDGAPEVVTELWSRTVPPTRDDVAKVVALRRDGTELWRRHVDAAIVTSLGAADLDGDGTPEVLAQTDNGAAHERYRAMALAADGGLRWRSPNLGRTLTSTIAAGDLLGEGRPQVAVLVAPGPQSELVLLDGADGSVRLRRALDGVQAQGGPVLADLDGDDDGRPEILVNTGRTGASGKLYAFEPELPDLRLTNLTFSTAEHAVEVPETIRARVANVGSRPAAGAVVRFTDGGVPLGEVVLDLAPGAAQEVSLAWTPAFGGPREVRAAADPDKAIPEWGERDNEQRATVNVRSADFRLADGDPAFSDPSPGVGDTIQVRATVSNVGGKAGTDVRVRFLDHGAPFAEAVVPSLPPGAAQELVRDLLVQGEFVHRIEVVADPDGEVAEEDEGNNRAGRDLHVRFLAPDLAPGDLAVSDPNPDDGDVLQVDATVRNEGSPGRDARDVLVRLRDRGAVVAEAVLDRVPSGGSATARLSHAMAGVGPRTLEVEVDPLGAIAELDETDNTAEVAVVVGKVDVAVAMAGAVVPFQQQATGVASLRFRSTGQPLAFHEFLVPVEYVVRTAPDEPAVAQAANLAAAVLAQARAGTDQALRVCVAGRCLAAALDGALDAARTLGAGGAAGAEEAELRWLLATIEARTNRTGHAAFVVPYSAFGAVDGLRGLAGARACAPPVAALDAAGQPQPPCVEHVAAAPSPPGAANVPGRYRATGVVDWYGFGFHGGASWDHV